MANTGRQMPTKQSQQKPPEISKVYDPVKTAEGMFNGCVSRIALALRDPKSYGEYTPYIIAESSKLFQDALDDLSLQVLDVKWLLEQKLAQNKSRREAQKKAKESETAAAAAAASTPSKRKHNELEESPETPTKRLKSADQQSPKPVVPAQNGPSKTSSTQPSQKPTPQSETITIDDSEPEKPTPVEPIQQSKPDPVAIQQPEHAFDNDDFGRPSAQGTPAMTEDGMDMFHSMFDSTDQNNDAASVNGGDSLMNFEFDNAFTQDQSQPDINSNSLNDISNDLSQTRPESQEPNPNQTPSLGSMLPGLEQYANMPNQSDGVDAGLGISQNTDANANDNPFLYGSGRNEFDDLLADDTMVIGDGTNDFGDVNVDIQENFDFDELFGID